MLSAKLAEGKIIIIDSDEVLSNKSRFLKSRLPKKGKLEKTLVVGPKHIDSNFYDASKNL